jgi:NADPH:quinone reductase
LETAVTKAVVIEETGGPEVLRFSDVPVGTPARGELLVRQTAIGVNFHDVYVRSGLYRTLDLPGIPGIEAVGVVDSVGPDTDGFAPGDRIAYITPSYGAYAESRILPAAIALRLPETLDDIAAASTTLKGLTACMLLRHVHVVEPGEIVLVHAGAGGVGQLLCRWAKHLGATVITTVGSEEKARIARDCGADHVILYRDEDFVSRVRDLTGGEGVAVAYDSVGKDTFLGSLECLAYLGKLVNFGQSSGAVDPFSPARLAARSNALFRPVVFHFVRERPALDGMAKEMFEAIAAGVIRAETGLCLPLAKAAEAHRALEGRRVTGAVVLVAENGSA